jgi:hypothetical protein
MNHPPYALTEPSSKLFCLIQLLVLCLDQLIFLCNQRTLLCTFLPHLSATLPRSTALLKPLVGCAHMGFYSCVHSRQVCSVDFLNSPSTEQRRHLRRGRSFASPRLRTTPSTDNSVSFSSAIYYGPKSTPSTEDLEFARPCFPSIFDVSGDGKFVDGRTTEVHVCLTTQRPFLQPLLPHLSLRYPAAAVRCCALASFSSSTTPFSRFSWQPVCSTHVSSRNDCHVATTPASVFR